MVADLSLDKEALKAVIRKKRLELVGQRQDVAFVMSEFQYSERDACKLISMDRTSYRYRPRPDHNGELRSKLIRLARQKPTRDIPPFPWLVTSAVVYMPC
jgi:hypothetical protein